MPRTRATTARATPSASRSRGGRSSRPSRTGSVESGHERAPAHDDMTLFVAAVLLSLAAPGAAADRGLAWRVMGSDGRGRAVCQDGDARCDRDGTADGACMVSVELSLGDEGSV